ncbi:MAG: SOS response-associated peptidase [Thiobacillaceae bacterium]
MRGRFPQSRTPAELVRAYDVAAIRVHVPEFRPRYNLAPSQPVMAVRLDPQGQRELVTLRWGLIPHWAKEPKTEYSTINARAETVAEKPLYREAFKRRRCLIPADSFYEWQRRPGGKQPYRTLAAEGRPLTLAGLWERWEGKEHGPIESCPIVVTAANAFMEELHDRMPVMLTPDTWAAWLDPKTSVEKLNHAMGSWPDGLLTAYPITRALNAVKNDNVALIQPLH